MGSHLLDRKHSFFVFHGTEEKSAENILKEGFKITRELRDDHWLGEGVYFFRDDAVQAKLWAISKTKPGQIYVVLEGNIIVNEKNFLNLDTRHGMITLKNIIGSINRTLKEENIGIILDGKNDAQCRHFIFSLIPEKDFFVIQRTFNVRSNILDNEPILTKMGLHLNGIQICVRNVKVISRETITVVEKEKNDFPAFKYNRKKQKKSIQL